MWVWVTVDRDSRKIVADHLGDRYTNAWEAYQGVFPSSRHPIISKDRRATNHLEQ